MSLYHMRKINNAYYNIIWFHMTMLNSVPKYTIFRDYLSPSISFISPEI